MLKKGSRGGKALACSALINARGAILKSLLFVEDSLEFSFFFERGGGGGNKVGIILPSNRWHRFSIVKINLMSLENYLLLDKKYIFPFIFQRNFND